MFEFLTTLNQSFTFFVIFPAILICGLLLTYKLKYLQITKLPLSFKYLIKSEEGTGSITHYEAISAVLAGNFGTGNISGMAVALSVGGPGALVWMWIMSFFGSIVQYASCLLGVKYREKNEDGEYVGGPMYYLSRGLNKRTLGVLFSICAILGAITCGNFAQVNSVMLPLQSLGVQPLAVGVFLAIISGVVILGGISRFAKVASSIVPLMAFIYFVTALIILFRFKAEVPDALSLMFKSAFTMKSTLGGALGFGLFKALSTGFERGVFATDVGTGLAPILQAGAQTKNPVIDAVISLIAPFMVMLVCTTTALIILVTKAHELVYLKSTNMVTFAFDKGLDHPIGKYIVIGSLFLFAYTTILAWCCVAEKAWGFIFGTKNLRKMQLLYIFLIPIGSLVHVDLIWLFADIIISCMLTLNLYGILKLMGVVEKETREYFGLAPSSLELKK
jgi:alanine or glycine:cation symporter, AGCS family